MFKSMTTAAPSLAALAATLAVLHAAPAWAQFSRTFVSSNGLDTNSCGSPNSACQTFSGALAKTLAGGEVTVVNTGAYGAGISINKSVSITNDGAGEAVIQTGSVGIDISAGPGDIVGLRGLTIDGVGVGARGIDVTQATAVHVQNCVVKNFQGASLPWGIAFRTGIAGRFFVSDTLVYNNGSTAATGGIWIVPASAGSTDVVLDRVHLENNVIGLLVDGSQGTGNGAHVVVRDSVASGNVGDGIRAFSLPGRAPAFILVELTSSVNNLGVGIQADGPRATILLKNNTLTRNGTGIRAVNSGQLISYGNNTNNNNLGSEGAPTGFFSQM